MRDDLLLSETADGWVLTLRRRPERILIELRSDVATYQTEVVLDTPSSTVGRNIRQGLRQANAQVPEHVMGRLDALIQTVFPKDPQQEAPRSVNVTATDDEE